MNARTFASDNIDVEHMEERYSTVELAEFRGWVERDLAAARTHLALLEEQLDEDRDVSEPGGQVEGETTTSPEESDRLIQRQRQRLRLLEEALIRIGNGSYGLCSITGKKINKERLRLMPYTTVDIAGQKITK